MKRIVSLIIAASHLAPLLTAASLYPYPIIDTGQADCYDQLYPITAPQPGQPFYGQDAQHTGTPADYSDNGDGTITDNTTGLMWQKSPDTNDDGVIDYDDKMTYSQAVTYAQNLTLAGHTDWRLPDIKTLYSLMDFRGTDPSSYTGTDPSVLTPFIDTAYFDFGFGDTSAGERLIDAQFASSTLYVSTTMNSAQTMFGLNLADGRIKGYPVSPLPDGGEKKYYVLCVRGNTAYGQNDFIDNGDGTITDKASGLMWIQNDSGAGLNWQQALAWAQTQNAANALGYNDWRLPNAKELQSLIDYTRSPATTASAAIDPLFNATAITNEAGQPDYPYYWTSTTHANWTTTPGGYAAYVAFGRAMGYMFGVWIDVHGAGAQRSDPKSGDPADWPFGHGPQGDAIRIYNYVRLVRTLSCGQPHYFSGLTGDLDNDCYVNLSDLAKLGQNWNALYELSDLAAIAQNWLTCTAPGESGCIEL